MAVGGCVCCRACQARTNWCHGLPGSDARNHHIITSVDQSRSATPCVTEVLFSFLFPLHFFTKRCLEGAVIDAMYEFWQELNEKYEVNQIWGPVIVFQFNLRGHNKATTIPKHCNELLERQLVASLTCMSLAFGTRNLFY